MNGSEILLKICPAWEVSKKAWKLIEPCLELPDPKDRYVLAAAIAGHVDSIVIQNLKDFPISILKPLEMTAIHPDEFFVQAIERNGLIQTAAFLDQTLPLI